MMNSQSETENVQYLYKLPITSIRRLFIMFTLLSFLLILLSGVLVTCSHMKHTAISTYQNIASKVSQNYDLSDDFINLIGNNAAFVLRDANGQIVSVSEGLTNINISEKLADYQNGFTFLDGKLTFVYLTDNVDGMILIAVSFMPLFKKMWYLLLIPCLIFIGMEFMLYQLIKKQLYNQTAMVENLILSNDKLEKRLYRDGLTEVMTRSMFLIQAEKLLTNHQGDDLITLCFVDLDDLKILNDTYGHQAGDIALKQIGSALRVYEQKYQGAVGRYGGDEFVLLLQGINTIKELNKILTELTKQLRFAISYRNELLSISCSIGAEIWNQKDDLELLIAKADKALYEIKRHGKGDYLILNGIEKS